MTKILKEIEKVTILIDKNPSTNLLTQLENLQLELNKILDYETKGLIIRSRARWMEEGERSSKYFCNLEKRNCEKKNIKRLKNDNDEMVSNPPDIMKEFFFLFLQDIFY